MATDLKGRKIKPHPSSPPGTRLVATANEAITKNQICYIDATGSAASASTNQLGLALRQKAGVATNATRTKAVGDLYIALNAAASGAPVTLTPVGLLRNIDTSGAAKGDAVYLGTAGAPTLTATGYQRRIGTVLVVGASGTGVVSFNPAGTVPTAKIPIVGVAAVAGAATVTVAAATLGGSFANSPAFAMCATVDGVKYAASCTWTGTGSNDLLITFNVAYTGNVNYLIWV